MSKLLLKERLISRKTHLLHSVMDKCDKECHGHNRGWNTLLLVRAVKLIISESAIEITRLSEQPSDGQNIEIHEVSTLADCENMLKV